MILTKEVEVLITNRNVTHFKNKGYDCNVNDIVCIKVEDLSNGSMTKIQTLCDYCLEDGMNTIIEQKYSTYLRSAKNGSIYKDCCTKCAFKKRKEVNLLKYGVHSPMHRKEIRDKVSQKAKLPFEMIEDLFKFKNYTLLSKEDEYAKSTTKLRFICNIHPEQGEQMASYNKLKFRNNGCKVCGINRISKENSYMWKGGISSLHNYLRKKIDSWKRDSMASCNYKCIMTGLNFDVIHHVYSFSNLLKETLSELGYEIFESINEYSNGELQNIEMKLLEKHYNHPLGVCLVEPIHKLYHSLYGEGNNTPIQFEEFRTRLKLGEFDSFLEENESNLII